MNLKNTLNKRSQIKRVHMVLFHLYEIQKQAKSESSHSVKLN